MRRALPLWCALLPALAVAQAAGGDRAVGPAFAVQLAKLHAWCDHMPRIGEPGGRRHLTASVTLTSRTKGPLEVRLERASISFEATAEGAPVSGLSLRGARGEASGRTSVTLPPAGELQVELRGDGLYPEGKHGERLYLTLVFSAGGSRLVVRGSSVVQKTS